MLLKLSIMFFRSKMNTYMIFCLQLMLIYKRWCQFLESELLRDFLLKFDPSSCNITWYFVHEISENYFKKIFIHLDFSRYLSEKNQLIWKIRIEYKFNRKGHDYLNKIINEKRMFLSNVCKNVALFYFFVL